MRINTYAVSLSVPGFPKRLPGNATIKHQSILQIITYRNQLKGVILTNGLLGPAAENLADDTFWLSDVLLK